MRSIVVPHTIASETAQKANWKRKNAAELPPTFWSGPVKAVAKKPSPLMTCPGLKKNPESPKILPAPPKARAKPMTHQPTDATERLTKIFATIAPTEAGLHEDHEDRREDDPGEVEVRGRLGQLGAERLDRRCRLVLGESGGGQ
jgi:hypothetical protein